MTARFVIRLWVVATERQRIIDAEAYTALDDLCFGEIDQRRMDRDAMSLDTYFRGEVRHGLERFDVLRPAIRVAGVVDRVDADEDVSCAENLGIGEGKAQEDRVSGWNVGDGNIFTPLSLRERGWG